MDGKFFWLIWLVTSYLGPARSFSCPSCNCVREDVGSVRTMHGNSQGLMGERANVAEYLYPPKARDVMAFCVNESLCNSEKRNLSGKIESSHGPLNGSCAKGSLSCHEPCPSAHTGGSCIILMPFTIILPFLSFCWHLLQDCFFWFSSCTKAKSLRCVCVCV